MKKRKLLSFLTALAMILSLMPANLAFADAAADLTDTNTGITLYDTDEDGYYEIATADALTAFANLVNGGQNTINAELTADIDLGGIDESGNGITEKAWTPIGNNSTQFKGEFDGGNKTIKGLYINNTSNYQGLFGYIYGGTVKNLTVEGSVTVNDHSGGIVGLIKAGGTITNCEYRGSVEGNTNVGGIVGYVTYDSTENNYTHSTITGCRNYGTVTGNDYVGCIAGTNLCGDITQCYNVGTVTGGIRAGGIVGYNNNNNSKIQDCYNIGTVTGKNKVGGIAGINTMSVANCYNFGNVSSTGTNVGAIVGENTGTCSKCYYLENMGAEGTGTKITAEQLAQESTFVGWDFESTWEIQTGGGYRPTLRGNKEVLHSETYPKLIKSLADLEAFRNEVNNQGNTYEGKFIKLTADIDLGGIDESGNGITEKAWTPIGKYISSTNDLPFKGIFNGNGKKIKGLYIKGTSSYQGLFGYIYGGTVKDLTVEGSVKGGYGTGGIVGCITAGRTITNCEYRGSVEGNSAVGGIVGSVIYDMAGSNYTLSTITGCRNYGTVKGADSVGGIVGDNLCGDITQCYNAGTVTGNDYVGGIAGYIASNGTTITPSITDCYNVGTVTGNDYVGGIAGDNSYNSTITNCHNVGNVSSTGTNVGAVVGYNTYSNKVQSCYYLNTCITENNTYGTGVAEEDFDNVEKFSGWDFESTWEIQTGGGYRPTLRGNKEVLYSETYPKLIRSLADLEALYSEVKDGTSYEGKFIKLTADIDMSDTYNSETGESWKPIGNSGHTFMGTFDGNGHSIKGLYINNSEGSYYQGLFGYIKGGTVKNLTVYGSVTSGDYVGGIVGYNEGSGQIINCKYIGSVTGSDDVGGIVGYNDGSGCKITDCEYTGSVKGNMTVGGIVGYNVSSGQITNCDNTGSVEGNNYVGGIVGYNYSSDCTTTDCDNNGTVTGTGNYAGGIVGKNDGTITKCSNNGTITGKGDYAGGIAGKNGYTITKCSNNGTVTGTGNYAGGIAGENNISITECYNVGTVTGTGNYAGGIAGYNNGSSCHITDCYNVGTVKGNEYVCGIAGSNEFEIKNCYNIGIYTGNDNTDGISINLSGAARTNCYGLDNVSSGDEKLNEEEFKVLSNFDSWSDTIWEIQTGGGYRPTLKNNIEPLGCESYPKLISTAEELAALRDGVNDGTDNCSGKFFKLKADIDLGGTSWTPIGNDTEGRAFMGYFDGNGHSITGLYINGTGDYQGLFGYIGEGGTVKNLTVGGSVTGMSNVGSIAGASEGTIENCLNTASVTATTSNAGGIAGSNSNKIANCLNTALVTVGDGVINVGGIVGTNGAGTVENCYYKEGCIVGATGNGFGTPKSEAELASGEVANLLQGEQTEPIWGQTLKSTDPENFDKIPVTTNDILKRVCSAKFMVDSDDEENPYELYGTQYANYNKLVPPSFSLPNTIWRVGEEKWDYIQVKSNIIAYAVGYSVKFIGDEGVKISVPEAGTYKIIFASYSTEGLIDVKSSDDIILENWTDSKIVPIPDDLVLDGAQYLKFFFWDDLTSMTPRCNFAIAPGIIKS